MYAYEFTLCRRAVVVAMDLSAKNLHLLRAGHCLPNPKNVLLAHLYAFAWETGAPVAAPGPRPMHAWRVE
eukprot:5610465-Lingulodinium_polyedra.AAC.1